MQGNLLVCSLHPGEFVDMQGLVNDLPQPNDSRRSSILSSGQVSA